MENIGEDHGSAASRNPSGYGGRYVEKVVESQRKKNIGKPYEGKPHVRFDEGKLEQKRDGKAISKEICFSFLLYERR
ncbi:hypothetical protein WAZ07_10345 [Bacillus sp. FJAT-51639]|uniref:Uncharacterized protein n=1 Tax=Bacillus bruguierae TaxID=3127667 RepID=A0ABU8FGB3_9BACI